MLEAACRQAENVLLDQTYFALDSEKMAAFQACSTTRLHRLTGFAGCSVHQQSLRTQNAKSLA